MAGEIVCWEVAGPAAADLSRARQLYETTQPADERIPWEWIAGAATERWRWRPGRWSPHLLLAGRRGRGRPAALGFAYGLHLPAYGGYLSYIGVAPAQRGHGVAGRLLEALTCACQLDGACEGSALPFVVWESRAPAAGDGEGVKANWRARLRFFEKVGALWASGLTLHVPNFHRRGALPVPLQFFVRPVDRPAKELDGPAAREAAAGLLRIVYRQEPGSKLWGSSLPEGGRVVLRPPTEAVGLTSA